jgi:queuine tRNA-ribosyltransferase
MKNTAFSGDLSPISDECQCHCCINYSCAYLHHLFACREMLGNVLLQQHNLHAFGTFLELIKSSILNGNFLELKQNFQSQSLYYLAAQTK